MKATPEQRTCLDAFNDGGNLRIEAAAGSGKTTVLRYIVYRGHLDGRALYTTFGKANIADARKRFPADRIAVATNHSLAFRGFGSAWQQEGRLTGRVMPWEVQQLMGWMDGTFAPHANARTGAHLVMSTLDQFLQSSSDEILVGHAMRVLGRRIANLAESVAFAQRLVNHARDVWARMMQRGDAMKITHDVYLKAWALTKPQLGFRHIFLDEAQDTSELMVGLLREQQNCQLTHVGDRYQSIYSWRGAINAMDSFDHDNSTQLTQSFRFGPAIAHMANAVLGEFLQAELRLTGFNEIQSTIGPVEDPACVLARTNASLFGELIQRLVHSPQDRLGVVGGVEDMEKLVAGAEALMRFERTWVPELVEFRSWTEVVSASKEEGYQFLKSLVELVETYGTQQLRGFLARVKGNEKDEASCKQLFSTVHKAKGREFDTVRLCDDFQAPPQPGDDETVWNPEEGNLLYVAVTRARQRLDITGCSAAFTALAKHNAHANRSQVSR